MFAYCGNNPVNFSDLAGESLIAALLLGGAVIGTIFLAGCSKKSKPEPKPEPYKSADEAARAFSNEVYSSSSYIRHEYSTEIYSRTVNGKTTYNYNPPRAGQPHSSTVGNPTPKGTKMVAYAHTHPTSNFFSGSDKWVAEGLKVNAYMVGPNLELQMYDISSDTIMRLGKISPIALTDSQKDALVTQFRVSWDAHISNGCNKGCENISWPTS